ncbi:MAG: NADP-dependent malic enzyme [Geminicoccaceae bacterium]|nr:MAG: NADP-dependent malic enzyme [Geminicoccaceae bacterium]
MVQARSGFSAPPASEHEGRTTDEEALELHRRGRPGKLEIAPTKPLATSRDLSLAYSPGVAVPCLEIEQDPAKAYDYTAKGNLVAVISNGTAVLGLGNIGALASKPVMEGKAVLFKRFADIDGIDLELATEDVDAFVQAASLAAPSFGGINLEDIKAPECFVIEERLKEALDIPVFHDDQHGTAVIAAAGVINALHLTGRTLEDTKLVVNGAGAAAIACVDLLKAMGLKPDNVLLCDTKGVVHRGRTDGMNQWKSAHAVDTDKRTLADAFEGADLAFGLSVAGAFTPEMIASMAPNPIIFAMANPNPEITPEQVKAVRQDAIVATGRSDYPNQVNNVLGFPYIFRGALDVRASTINDAMKIAAAYAIADLAREDVPDEVSAAYRGRRLQYGQDYIIPTPFDPRLVVKVPLAVAKAATESGVARKPLFDARTYEAQLRARLDPTASRMQQIIDTVAGQPKRIVFAEGEEETTIRAALAWRNAGLGTPILVGRDDRVRAKMDAMGLGTPDGIEIQNARLATRNEAYADFLYARLQRKGLLERDVMRLVNQERNVFGACMVAMGDADVLVTGLTRNYTNALQDIVRVLDPKPEAQVFGLSIVIARGRTVFLADTAVHELPTASIAADIAIQAAAFVRQLGLTPRVAALSFATFGNREVHVAAQQSDVIAELDHRGVDFEYEGEMEADIALDAELLKLYPFARLSQPANILMMPALHSATIASKLLRQLGGGQVIGPILMGLAKPAQIVPMNATVSDLINLGAIGAFQAIQDGNGG